MTPITISRTNLEKKDNLLWFDTICDVLKRDKHPTVRQLTQFIGIEKPNPDKQIRGSKFLIPFDKRFEWACISPDWSATDAESPIDYFAIGGKNYLLKMSDIIERFPTYKTLRNTYDGGTQIFIYPVPEEFEFSGLSFNVEKEIEEITDITILIFNSVAFKFGDKLIEGRDGFGLRR